MTDETTAIRAENTVNALANIKYVTTVLLVVALCACGSTTSPEPGRLVSSADKWVGHTVDELIVAYGEPISVHRLNAGGRMFEYVMDSADKKLPARTQKNASKKSGNPSCKLLFAISASDIVENWKTEGDKCN